MPLENGMRLVAPLTGEAALGLEFAEGGDYRSVRVSVIIRYV